MGFHLITFIQANYLTLMMLFGLAVVMLANRDTWQPEVRIIWGLMAVLLAIIAEQDLYQWAQITDNRAMLYWTSVADYSLYPIMILLEVLLLTKGHRARLLTMLPALLNQAVLLLNPLLNYSVFSFDGNNNFQPGPLRLVPFLTGCVYILLMLVRLDQYFRNRSRRYSAITAWIVASTLVVIFLQYFNIITDLFDEVAAMDIMLYYFFIFAVEREQTRRELSEKALELSRTRVRLMSEQIQPHFIFNSLAVIRALIWVSPQKASDSLDDFSGYLRSNLDALRSDELIPFDKELEHIQAFLSLALVDDVRNIQVHYDLQVRNFRLPALTVEPAVENAIRHGLNRTLAMSLLEIATREDAESVIITVRDNGVGFDVSTLRAKSSRGVGVENVRTKLQLQCGGSMDIKSGNEGTTVTIKIPKTPPAELALHTESEENA